VADSAVTGGKGYFQEEGIGTGDQEEISKIKPNMKHWHGATPIAGLYIFYNY